EWLLLPFGPWLFVTVLPLSTSYYVGLQDLKLLNTFAAQTPPILVNVPILFILTLFFKGKQQRWQTRERTFQSFLTTVIRPSLPLALLLAGIAVFIGMHDLVWSLIVSRPQNSWTFPVSILLTASSSAVLPYPVFQYTPYFPRIAALITLFDLPVFLITMVILGLFQGLYLDRLAVGFEKPAEQPSVQEILATSEIPQLTELPPTEAA